MTSETPQPKPRIEAPKKKSKWGGCLILLGIALVLFVLLPAGAIIGWQIQSSRMIKAQLEALRDRGEPTTADELAAYYAVPDGKVNTTQLWLEAMAPFESPDYLSDAQELPIVGDGEAEIPLPPQTWDDLEAVREFLDQYEHEMALMHEASELAGAARYRTEFQDGFSMLLPHAQNLRGCARMLSLETYLRAHDGDAHGAAESIRAILAAGRSLKNEPIMISQLVRDACEGIAANLVLKTLPTVEYSDEDLQLLQQDLLAGDFQDSLGRAIRGERVMGIVMFEDPAAVGEVPPGAARFLGGKDDLSLYLELMDELLAASEQPWPQALASSKKVSQQIQAKAAGSPLARMRYMLTLLMFPATDAIFQASARTEAANQAAAAAIGVQLYRRRHGKLPESLDQLAPEFLPATPIDPFDGKPLRFFVTDHSYAIYSVGENGIDDGGIMNEDTMEPDFVYEVQLAAPEEQEPAPSEQE